MAGAGTEVGAARRWVAVSGGVLINGLILAALALVERAPPIVEEQTVITLELRSPQRRTAERKPIGARRPSSGRTGVVEAPKSSPAGADPGGPTASGLGQIAADGIDPAWRVDPKAVERWRITEGAPLWNWGRYYRACKGLSSEHMTPEEKERCYGGWGGQPRDKRPSPGFVGPIDERKWEVYRPGPQPPSRYDGEVRRKQNCRDYRRGRTPGFSERNLDSTGGPPPVLREGGCF